MSNLITSLIRTYVPIVVGGIVSYLLVEYGIVVEEDIRATATVAVTGFLIAAYYTAVRLLAKRWPAFEHLLGVASVPVYATPLPAPADPAYDQDADPAYPPADPSSPPPDV